VIAAAADADAAPVAASAAGTDDAIEYAAALLDVVADGGVLVLTGAGISTESGIPDYRGPTGATRRHPPMTYQSFVGDEAARHRYWARGFLGWRQIADARPNAGHRALSELQRAGLLGTIITQNVDGLHQAGGAHDVVELHGGLDRIRCLDCGQATTRAELHERLRRSNPAFAPEVLAANADGDVDLPDSALAGFVAPICPNCASTLVKPDVVFFGESVPPQRVARCYELVAAARSMLVLGSSLTVFSGYRFARAAARRGIPLMIVNQGATRADDLADIRVNAALGPFLSGLAARLPPLPNGS
jgi:NAD-dependent SIR2 family protein deacetylase